MSSNLVSQSARVGALQTTTERLAYWDFVAYRKAKRLRQGPDFVGCARAERTRLEQGAHGYGFCVFNERSRCFSLIRTCSGRIQHALAKLEAGKTLERPRLALDLQFLGGFKIGQLEKLKRQTKAMIEVGPTQN